jgi:hypothetical protein
MARALSQDLRDRVIDATLAGMSARGAAARFGVGVSTAVAWAGRARQGDRHPQGQKRSSKLDAHRTFLLGLMAEKDDITFAQMHCCALPPSAPSKGSGKASATSSRPSPQPSAPTTSRPQDMTRNRPKML